MTKVQVLGLHGHLEVTLASLHALGVVQLIDVSAESDLTIRCYTAEDAKVRQADELRYLRARLEALLRLLPEAGLVPAELAPDSEAEDLAALRKTLDAVAPQVEALVEQVDELRIERAALPRHIQSVRRLLPLVPEFVQLERFHTEALLLERDQADLVDVLRQELQALDDPRHEIITARVDPDTIGVVLVFPEDHSEHVISLLARERVSQVRLPPRFEGLPLRRALVAMEERLAALPGLIEDREQELRELTGFHCAAWRAALLRVTGLLEQLGELEKVGTTGRTFVLRGWVPVSEVQHLEHALGEDIGREVDVSVLPLEEEERERAPVLLSNPRFAKPFEFLVHLFALPRHGTPDPSLLLTVFIPLFFGFMLGDVGHGLVLLGVAVCVRKTLGARSIGWHHLSSVLLLGSLSAVAFGIAFGELFGTLGHRLGLYPLWIDREQALVPLFVLSLAVGAMHVTLGLLLGVWSSYRTRRPSVLAEKLATLAALWGLLLLAAWAADRLPGGVVTPAVAAIVVGAAVLLGVQGALAPLELMRTVSNVFSYLRLAALGIASVYLARVANELGALGPVWLGVIVAALLHALNIALGAFSPTIQALRLHYVEFFGQFYEGGGAAFAPLGGSKKRIEGRS